MVQFNYFRGDATDWKPPDFGNFWVEMAGDIKWYESMYESRISMHRQLQEWIAEVEKNDGALNGIADFGCGLGVGYSDIYEKKEYIGIDISQENINWCNKNRDNKLHKYLCQDFISLPLGKKMDLVFSQGTIDNVYDMDEFIKSMVASSKKWIYLTAYRGWFPDLTEHEYAYSYKHHCFYNNISPARIKDILLSLGCKDIRIEPAKTDNPNIPYETRVIARV